MMTDNIFENQKKYCQQCTKIFFDKKSTSGDRHIVWRRGYDVLATGHIVIAADPRISVERHAGVNTLSIREVAEQDAGEYVCQVRRLMSVTWCARWE